MRNNISEINGLDKLSNLQDLYLSSNKITEIKELDNNVNLKELYIGHNNITELKGMQNLTKLASLKLDGTPLAKTIAALIGKSDYTPQDLVKYCQKKY